MSSAATIVPAESDLLCEGCGYTLNGLPIASNCPECGRAIETSIGTSRVPPVWEVGRAWLGPWLTMSLHVIFRPTHFYKTTTVRGDVPRARLFAWMHWSIAAALFATAAGIHTHTVTSQGSTSPFLEKLKSEYGLLALYLVVFVSLVVTTQVAAKLTAYEAAYRGLRLPIDVVKRGLYYHAAHYLPVALMTLATVLVYAAAVQVRQDFLKTVEVYLYVICGEVILFAGYLFHTYWIGMRNMMYANR